MDTQKRDLLLFLLAEIHPGPNAERLIARITVSLAPGAMVTTPVILHPPVNRIDVAGLYGVSGKPPLAVQAPALALRVVFFKSSIPSKSSLPISWPTRLTSSSISLKVL